MHREIRQELLEECDAINRQLRLSRENRPHWDQEVLEALGADQIQVDTQISRRIYREPDKFYNPTPMFCLTARKKEVKE